MVLGYRPQKCVLQVRRWVEDHGSPLWWRDGPEREKHYNYICWWGYTLIIWSYTRNWVRTFLIGYQYLKNRETSHKNLSVRYFLKKRKKKKKDYLVTLNPVLWRDFGRNGVVEHGSLSMELLQATLCTWVTYLLISILVWSYIKRL